MKAISPQWRWSAVAIGAIVLSLLQAGLFRQELINANGFGQLWQFVRASVHPELNRELLDITGRATIVTLAYAVCGTALSLVIGAIGGLFCAEVWWTDILRVKQGGAIFSMMRSLLAVPRAIHELIWGLFFVNIWGLDPLVAIVAIALPFGATTAKVFSELIDETPRQPLHALMNSGVPPLSAFFYTIFPQVFLNLLSYAFYRFECSIRSAAVLGVIGAGGLGYEILLSLQSLRYEQLWTFFYALFVLNGCVDVFSASLRNRLGCATRMDLKKRSRQLSISGRDANRYAVAVNLMIALTVVTLSVAFCFQLIQPDWSKLWSPRTRILLSQISASIFPPDFSQVSQLVGLSIETVAMSILAIAIAAIGGLLLAFPAARDREQPFKVRLIAARFVLLMARAIPAPIWALVVLFVVFPGILPGAIALGLHNLGILGRLLSEEIENLEQSPLEALKAQGAPDALVALYGVLPTITPRFLAYTLYRWEVCMRETVIVGLVGAGGLGRSLVEQLSSFDYRSLVVTLGAFLLLTIGVDRISGTVRRSLRS